MRLIAGALIDEEPVMELAFASALVRMAGDQRLEPTLRVYRPRHPMVVFGRRDTRLPGFGRAVEAARQAGFVPAVRATGGRAVAYTENAVVIDQVQHQPSAMEHHGQRFEQFGQKFVDVFRSLGIDACLGSVPGEYCPGAHSVNARGSSKLVGTAQRVIRNAWLFSSLVIVDDRDQIADVLSQVYSLLELPLDAHSVGSVAAEAAGVDVAGVERSLLAAWGDLSPGSSSATGDAISLAKELLPDHLPKQAQAS